MKLGAYYSLVGVELDKYYTCPDGADESFEKEVERVLDTDLFSYYERNIAPELAALFIANKLQLVKKNDQ